MRNTYFLIKRYAPVADLAIVLAFATAFYGLVVFGQEWRKEFQPAIHIDLSLSALPLYSLFSTIRALAAYLLSLLFTLTVGYWAAKSKWAEKIVIPLLDILQSIPVLGFLPGLVLGLIALFPHTNTGLELAAIIMIFTGQVWNMTFSYYASLKSVPADLGEAASVMAFSRWKRLLRLELPFSAVGLAWNSLMSMAGGWFFLSVCEAFTLGDQAYRLPGLGAYMAEAIASGNGRAMVMGIAAMVLIIIALDFFVWRPVLAWVHKFRLENVPGVKTSEPIIQLVLNRSRLYVWIGLLLRWMRALLKRVFRKIRPRRPRSVPGAVIAADFGKSISSPETDLRLKAFKNILILGFGATIVALMLFKFWQLVLFIKQIPASTWVRVMRNTLWTFLRVLSTLVFSSIWAVPLGVWIGMSPKRVKIAQPLIQVLASFPAPMLYPLVLGLFFKIGIGFTVASMFLMMLGVQWYVLFNVLAGAMRLSQELLFSVDLMDLSLKKRWTTLYLPSVFPALVTGWITAAGGAWNASVVAEYLSYKGNILSTEGLGSTISIAASRADFPTLIASLAVMVVTVILLNRTVWAKVYSLAQARYRMDL